MKVYEIRRKEHQYLVFGYEEMIKLPVDQIVRINRHGIIGRLMVQNLLPGDLLIDTNARTRQPLNCPLYSSTPVNKFHGKKDMPSIPEKVS